MGMGVVLWSRAISHAGASCSRQQPGTWGARPVSARRFSQMRALANGKDDGQGANAADFTDDIYESALTDAGAGMFGGDVSTSRGSKGSIAESLLTESELTSLRDLIPDPGDDIYEVGNPAMADVLTAEALKGEGIDADIPGLWGVWGTEDFIFDDYDVPMRRMIETSTELTATERKEALERLDMLKMSFHIQRREEIQKALFAGMALHHDHMERAHNRYAVSNRHAQHMEAINADDIYAGRVHQLPSFIRAYFQFHTEFDEWNEMNLAQMRAGEGQIDEEQQRRAALEEFDDSLETYFASADQRDSGKDPLDEFLVDILPGADADKSDEYLEQLLGAEALMEDGDDTVLLPGMDDASADPLDYASDKLA